MTTLDATPRRAPPWLVVLAAVLGIAVSVLRCAAGCGVDDGCAGVDDAGMPAPTTTAAILVASLSLPIAACDGRTSEDQTTGGSTGAEPHSLGFGEPCVEHEFLPVHPAETEPCKEGLICSGHGCGNGLCKKTCTRDEECPLIDGNQSYCRPLGGGESLSVCVFFCTNQECPQTLAQELICDSLVCIVPPEFCS